MAKKLAIFGSGGLAREIYWHLRQSLSEFEPVFIDPFSKDEAVRVSNTSYKIQKSWEIPDNCHEYFIGVGQCQFKIEFATAAEKMGLKPHAPVIHPDATVQDAQLGLGTIITPGCRLTTNISIGRHVLLNLNCTIGHDTKIGSFCTINPGVSISGCVEIGDACLIGTGACINENLVISENSVIGSQAAVVKSVTQAGITMVGVPAKILNRG